MTLTPGTRLGPYEITAGIGAGGMGEVYRATDTQLGRDVAVKVLPEAFAQDADRLARFQREAKALAALSHPNIAGIYGIEESPSTGPAPAGVRALIMELVDGDDLSVHIARGPLPVAEALPIARQIAAALEAAHGQGIIHRDLKPANVKVRADGTVKVLDFGLAKTTAAGAEEQGIAGTPANSPTLTARATAMGMILGTAAYMAPEQARGKFVDRRADVWAFGALVFEMLTGARAFPGDDLTDTLAAVVRGEPDWSQLPPDLPPTLGVFLRRCLEKDPKQRVPDMATLRLALDGAFDAAAAVPAMAAPAVARRASPALWGLAAMALVSLGVAVFALATRPASIPAASVRLTIPLPDGAELSSYPAITRDGRTVAYVAQQGGNDPRLYLRSLDSFEARLVTPSSGARQPFFSPDGRWIAFFAQGHLQKAEVAGGAPIRLAEAPYPFGGTWTDDNTIVYAASLGSGLLQVPAGGGAPRQLSKPDGGANGYAHVFPQALPGGKTLLATLWGQNRGTAVMSRDSGAWNIVLPSTTFASALYDMSSTAHGRLLTIDEAAGVRAAAFDPAHPARTSADVSVLDDVFYQLETEGQAWLAVSQNGTAVYASGNPAKSSLVWLGSDGTTTPVGLKQDVYREASVSPDGTKAVVRHGLNLWIHDLVRGTSSPLTSGVDSNFLPVWTRDGRRVVFASNRGGDWDIYSQAADGAGTAEVLLKRLSDQFPYAFATDGTLLYTEIGPATGRDLWTRSPDGTSAPVRVTPFNEWAAQFSPERSGPPRWIAYASDESGRPEIYVQSHPAGDRRIPVSTGGGVRPMWSPDGKELYYVTTDAVVMVAMQPNGTFGAPRKLADRSAFHVDDRFQSFSPAPDGKRLLMISRDAGSAPRQLNVILNWTASPGR